MKLFTRLINDLSYFNQFSNGAKELVIIGIILFLQRKYKINNAVYMYQNQKPTQIYNQNYQVKFVFHSRACCSKEILLIFFRILFQWIITKNPKKYYRFGNSAFMLMETSHSSQFK